MSADDELPDLERRRLRERLWSLSNRLQFTIYTVAFVVLIALVYVAPFMFIKIPTGYSGVMYRYFLGGTVTEKIWGEGLHVIPPWDTLTLYEIRLIEERIRFTILSEEGLDLGVEVSVRYRPNKDMLGFLHQDIGPDYYARLIKPEVEAHVRKTFGRRPAHEIYATQGDLLEEIRGISMLGRVDDAGEELTSRSFIQVQEIKIVDIDLPPIVEGYIAERYGQEQKMLEYEYRLLREEKEAERKRIEAAGIRDYNRIAASISHDLLRWRDIEATLALARSTNSKVVLLGAGASDTSLIFNLGDAPKGGAPEGVDDPSASGPSEEGAEGEDDPRQGASDDSGTAAVDASWDFLPLMSRDLPSFSDAIDDAADLAAPSSAPSTRAP